MVLKDLFSVTSNSIKIYSDCLRHLQMIGSNFELIFEYSNFCLFSVDFPFIGDFLKIKCTSDIADAAEMTVLTCAFWFLQRSTTELLKFLKAIFLAGRSVPFGIEINPKSYLPSVSAVYASFSLTAVDLRQEFELKLVNQLSLLGRAVSIDGASIRVQGRRHYDFAFHYIGMRQPKTVMDASTFSRNEIFWRCKGR